MRLAWLLLLLSCAPCLAEVRGVVYEDGNGNGVRDAGEPGIEGIKISNGRALVRSAADGSYTIPTDAGDLVFAVKPAGRGFGNRPDGLPASWQAAGTGDRFNVGLSAAQDTDGALDVLLFADPQVASLVDVDDYYTDIIEPLLGTKAALGITLGDIVDDELSLYPALNAVTGAMGVPWLHVAGNHDLDAAAIDDAGSLATFHRTFGPDTVAWEEAKATFIGLDDVIAQPGQRPAYVGGLREDQFDFLEAYLPTVDRSRLLVIGAHIPFFQLRAADRERLFALLRDFPHVLLLSGHTHKQGHVFHDAAAGWHGARPLHEYNVGAACGAFWSGVEDAAGVPDATMSDGTPNGYARLQVAERGEYRLTWHGARDTADTTIGLHAPKVLRRGAYPAFGVYANVYMGFEGSRVEYRIDDGAWQPMRKVLQPDPRLLAENARDDAATELRGYDRSPEADVSQHLWRGTLPTDLVPGEHAIEVRHFDPWRGEQVVRTSYRLDEAP